MKPASFTVQERKKILKLLTKAVRLNDARNIDELQGFFCGLGIIPEIIPSSEWLLIVFGEEMLEFASKEEVDKINLLFKIYNRFSRESIENRLCFPFDMLSIKAGDTERMGDWAHGFCQAIAFSEEIAPFDNHIEQYEGESPENRQKVSSAFMVITAVAKPEIIPAIIKKPGFDPDYNKKDLEAFATFLFMLPAAR